MEPTLGHFVMAGPSSATMPAGLTSAEAAEQLAKYGPNTIAEAHPNKVLALAHGFWGLVPWMLEAKGLPLSLVDLLVHGSVSRAFLGLRTRSRHDGFLA